MLHYAATYLLTNVPELGFLRLLNYTSVRAFSALLVAFFFTLLVAPALIRWLQRLKFGDRIRRITGPDARDLYEMHQHKEGTPTMGGVIILSALVVSALLFCDFLNPLISCLLLITLALGLIGFVDDYLKMRSSSGKGIRGAVKLTILLCVGLLLGSFVYATDLGVLYTPLGIKGNAHLCVPFVKSVYPSLGIFYILFASLVLVASANAVNLSDGLDGLAIGVMLVAALCFAIITYLVGRMDFARYLLIPHVPHGGEISVFLSALIGASLGFLWFNSYPAQVFMGDTGSLPLGGILGTVALLSKQELLLVIIGGIFVVEALSVILQVGSYKLRRKRIFLMSPLHHHFQRKGLPESKIVIRMWIATVLLALVGLGSLKLR